MRVVTLFAILFLLAGCGGGSDVPSAAAPVPQVAAAAASPTPVPPENIDARAATLAPPPLLSLFLSPLSSGTVLRANLILLASGQTLQRHYHPDHDEVFYVLRGAGTIVLGTTESPFKPGDFVYMPRGLAHSITADAGPDVVFYCNTAPQFEGDGRIFLAPGQNGPVLDGAVGPIVVADVIPQVVVPAGQARAELPLALGQLLQAGVIRMAAGQSLARHLHLRHEECVYVLQGQGTLTLQGQAYAVRPGDFFFLPVGVEHSMAAAAGVDVVLYCQTAPPFLGEDRFFSAQ